MNTRISHIFAWAHPRTAEVAVRGRALRGCTDFEEVWESKPSSSTVHTDRSCLGFTQTASRHVCRPCGLVPAAPPLLSPARAVRRSSTVLLLVLGLVFSWHTAQSQTFPVNALVQVSSFSPQLEAYDDPGRVVVTLISTDERPEYEALLRISLSGPGFNVRTREDFMPFPIILRRNQPLVLTGAQLRDYFDPANLNFQGETLENYLVNGGLLSEGPVSLCVEVYDFNRFFDPPVSNTGCATGFMLLHRPPILTEPGTEVEPSFPQQLRFQWQPQHAGVAVRYTLEVYEDILPGMGDNLIIDNTQPLLLKTTTAPFYTMTSLDPLLQVGTRYLVRIRAEDIIGQAAFLNDGWSDIYSFVYGSEEEPPVPCPQPENFTGIALDPFSLELSWLPNNTVASWLLTSVNGDSISLGDTAQTYTFTNLIHDQTYTYQLCAICTDGSNQCLQTAVTLPADTTSGPCGPALSLDNWPLDDARLFLSWNDIATAQGFRLRWGILPPNDPSTPVSPAPTRTQRQLPQPTPARRGRNRNRGLSPAPAPPLQTAPVSTIGTTVFAYTDSLNLPAGSIDSEIGLLEIGNTYQIELCKICPDGSLECITITVPFNGLDDACLTSLNIIRTDSTDTSLTLSWVSATNDYSADSTFMLIWQLSDGSAPADTATFFYPSGTFTIDSLEAFRAYDLRICAECTAGQPACRELEPFGGCPAAYEPFLADLDFSNALIAWDTIPGDSLIPTNARYKARVAFRWDSLVVGQNTYFTPSNYDLIAAQTAEISGLSQGITYLAQIQTQCADSIWSDWSVPVRFNTDCAATDSLWLNELTDSSALVAALAYSNADYYEFQYRRTDQQDWTTVPNLPTALLALSGLRAETEYEVRMRYWCTQGVWSDYTASFFFTTLPPCEPPFRITVDPILADAAQLNWDNYINATQVELRYRPKIGGYYYFSMWPPPWQTAVAPDSAYYLNDLQGGAAYEYQLRSDCAVNFSEWTNIDEFALLCAPPEVIAVTDSTYESAIVQLTGLLPSTQSSTLEYRRLGDSTWMSRATTYGFASLQNLDDMTYYELRATATCSSGETSAYSDTVQFRTPVKCLVPENLLASNLQPFSAQLDWDVTGTIDEWEIRVFGPIGSTIPAVEALQQAAPVQLGIPGGRTTPQTPGNPTPPSNTQPQNQQPSTRRGNVRQGGNPLSTGGPITSAPVTTAPVNTAPLGVSVGQAPAPAPFADWHSFFVTDPTKLLQELRQNTEYLVVVRARCPEFGWTDYSDTLSFRTLTDCRVPVNLVANEILQTTARTNWTAVNSYAEEYMVQLESLFPLTAVNFEAAPIQVQPGGGRTPQLPTGGGGQSPRIPAGGGDALMNLPGEELTNWFAAIYQDSILTPDLTAVFTGLRANTEYRFRVKSRCDNFGWTDYSDWLVFRTDHCAAPTAIVEEAIDRSTMNISWTPSNGINDYEFKYKLADDPGADWITIMTQDSFVELNSLLTNQIYDYQITEICQGGTGQRFAPQDSFLMERPSLNNGFYVCGVEGEVDLSNQVPLAALIPGDTIIAFDFPIIITMASGGGGYFSGMGDIRMPYFNKAKFSFEFDNIFVNDEYRMVGGYLEATGFGVEVLPPWADSLLSDILDVLELADSVLQEEQIGTLEELLALGENANLPPDLQQAIQDVLDCFEQATTQAQIDSCNVLLDSVIVEVNEFLDELYEGDFQVVFKKDESQQFGFDGKRSQEPDSWYEKRTLAGADYLIPYKSVKGNSPEIVDGVVLPPGSIDSVAFSQPSGIPLPVTVLGDTATITFIGQTGDDYYLVAEQITNDSTPNHIAGLLSVVPYPELPLEIVLVPLSNSAANGLSAGVIEQGLLRILGQAVVKPTVTIEGTFTAAGYDGTLDAAGSGLLSNYSPEMGTIIDAYENRPEGIDPNKYYLFLTDSYEPTTRAGFMPRGRQFGFLYMGNTGTGPAFVRTLAHELGHGAYVLKHTFQEYESELPENSTDNLMDYGTGAHLYKWQWDLIHNPVAAPLLPGDESGELLGANPAIEDDIPVSPDANFESLAPGCKFVKTARGVYVRFSDTQLQQLSFKFDEEGNVSEVNDNGTVYLVHYVVNNVPGNSSEVEQTPTPVFRNKAMRSQCKVTVKRIAGTSRRTNVYSDWPANSSLDYEEYWSCGSSSTVTSVDYLTTGGVCKTKSCGIVVNLTGVEMNRDDIKGLVETINTFYNNNGEEGRLLSKVYVSDSGDAAQRQEVEDFIADQDDGFITLWIEVHTNSEGVITGFNEVKTGFYENNSKIVFGDDNGHFSLLGIINTVFSASSDLISAVITTVTDPVSWLLEGIADIIGTIEIPAKYYDCSLPDYNPIVYEIYSVAEYALPGAAALLPWQDGIITDYWNNNFSSTGLTLEPETLGQMRFALLCGMVNEVFKTIQGIPLFLNMVVESADEAVTAPLDAVAFLTDPETNLSETFSREAFAEAVNVGLAVVDTIGGQIVNAHDPTRPCKLAYSIGRDIIFGLSFFVGIGELNALRNAARGVQAASLVAKTAPRLQRAATGVNLTLKWARSSIATRAMAFILMTTPLSPGAKIVKGLNHTVGEAIELVIKTGDDVPTTLYSEVAESIVRTSADDIIEQGGRQLQKVSETAPQIVHVVDDAGTILHQTVNQQYRVIKYQQMSQEGMQIGAPVLALVAHANDPDPPTQCQVCVGRTVQAQYENICQLAPNKTVAQQALNKICTQNPGAGNDAKLTAIGVQMLSFGANPTKLNAFFNDVIATQSHSSDITSNVDKLENYNVEGWGQLYSAQFSINHRRRVIQLYDNQGKPRIVLKKGINPSNKQLNLTVNWYGNQITEPFSVIEEPSVGNALRYRFRYFRETGTAGRAGPIQHHVIPATPPAGAPATLAANSLLNMQGSITNVGDIKDNANNVVGHYYTLANAYQLQLGEGNTGVNGIEGMSLNTFLGFSSSSLTVYKSLDPDIPGTFTADHRRPMAVRLAGMNPQLPLNWVQPVIITRTGGRNKPSHWWKMTTTDEGKDIDIIVHYINVNGQDKFCPKNTPNRIRAVWKADWNGSSYQIKDQSGSAVSWPTIGAMIPGDCRICAGRAIVPLFEEICLKAGSTEAAKQGLEKLCTDNPQSPNNDAQLQEIGTELLSWNDADLLNAFFDDINGSSSSSDHLANRLSDLEQEQLKSWKILKDQPERLQFPVLERLHSDLENVSDLESYLDTNPSRVADWAAFDDFFANLNASYWTQFNSPPTNLTVTRNQALAAFMKYPSEYVDKVVALQGSKVGSAAELYTRHGVDYGEDYFTIMDNFAASNPGGLTEAEYYSIFGYTTNFFYKDLNAWLRGSINASQTGPITNLVNGAIAKLPLWVSGTEVYRGIKISGGAAEIAAILANYPEETIVTEKAFTSVGESLNTAFMNHPTTKIKMVFTLKTNSAVKDISALADGVFYRGFPPPELIFPANTQFYVDDIIEDAGVHTVFLTEQ